MATYLKTGQLNGPSLVAIFPSVVKSASASLAFSKNSRYRAASWSAAAVAGGVRERGVRGDDLRGAGIDVLLS